MLRNVSDDSRPGDDGTYAVAQDIQDAIQGSSNPIERGQYCHPDLDRTGRTARAASAGEAPEVSFNGSGVCPLRGLQPMKRLIFDRAIRHPEVTSSLRQKGIEATIKARRDLSPSACAVCHWRDEGKGLPARTSCASVHIAHICGRAERHNTVLAREPAASSSGRRNAA